MKIALIDTGISRDKINNKCEIRHFSLEKENLIEKYKKPENGHGTDCFKEIISNTKKNKIQILDFNILDNSKNLKVVHVISAIEKAIKERVDIINISLGLTVYSQELYDICEVATQNNIVILSAASHSNTISFPADFNNVICVKVDQQQKEKMKTIDDTTISVSMRDFIITEKDMKFDFSSSSLACARVCGYLCDELNDMPLNDKFKMLLHKYNISLKRSEDITTNADISLKESGIHDILINNKVAVVIFPSKLMKNIDRDLIQKNIVAYYNHDKDDFYSFIDNKPTKDFDVIMILNCAYVYLEVPRTIKEKYSNYKVIYIGNFLKKNHNKYLYDYNIYQASEMSVLERPVIVITSLCSELNKIDVQLSLLSNLKQDELKVESVSNNPIGVLYDTNVFNFPSELKFPNIVYSINKFMYLCEVNKEIDAWLINIGGGISQINNLNTYNFGKLVDSWFSATNVDITIICVNPSIDISYLKLQLAYLYKHGSQKVFIVLSHNDINTSTMDYRDGVQTYYIDDEKYFSSFEYLKQNIQEKVFSLDDVQNGNLYKNIIEALS